MATAISLMLLGSVIVMFGDVSEKITESRSLTEMAERLRLTQIRLQQDLAGVTVTMSPPRKPSDNEGYFEYIEGPAIVQSSGSGSSGIAVNSEVSTTQIDPTVGDFDDILMFTTRTTGRPFVGRFNGSTIQSNVAEVAWFVRGRTLHRRVLLVTPGVTFTNAGTANFYNLNDVSAHPNTAGTMTANTLGDLTLRENRFAHWNSSGTMPWSWTYTGKSGYTFPTLPTLAECSANGWLPSSTAPSASLSKLDFWMTNSTSTTVADWYYLPDDALATGGTRTSDDVILTNVIGFDVKAWDPHYNGNQGTYVNLGYGSTTYSTNNANTLAHLGANNVLLGTANTAKTYDTWSTTYLGTAWNNGLDGVPSDSSTQNGIVDDYSEITSLPPYPVPLRGIQVKIRAFDPDSKQIREVTVVQDFLP